MTRNKLVMGSYKYFLYYSQKFNFKHSYLRNYSVAYYMNAICNSLCLSHALCVQHVPWMVCQFTCACHGNNTVVHMHLTRCAHHAICRAYQHACTVFPNTCTKCPKKVQGHKTCLGQIQGWHRHKRYWGDLHHPHISICHPYILKVCTCPMITQPYFHTRLLS